MIVGINGRIGSGKDTFAKLFLFILILRRQESFGGKRENILNPNAWTFEKIAKYKWEKFPFYGGWEVKKFAAKLKQISALLLGCKVEDFENESFKNQLLPDEWQIWEICNFGKPKSYQDHLSNSYIIDTEAEAQLFCLENSSSQHQYTYRKSERTYRWFLQDLGTRGIRGVHPNAHINALMSEYDKEANWLITDYRFLNEGNAIEKFNGIKIRISRHKRFDDFAFWQLVANKLDIYNPNPDYSNEYARRLDLDYDDSTEEYIDKEDIHRGKEHESETALDNYIEFDYDIDNNGTIEELAIKIEEIIIDLKL